MKFLGEMRVLLLVTVLILTCAIAMGEFGLNTGAEPTGENWRPVLLPSAYAINVPPPPVPGSTQAKAELNELRDIQARRTPVMIQQVHFWDTGGVVHWNEIARNLVATQTTPLMAARVYALLSVAQYDALVAAWAAKYRYQRRAPAQEDPVLHPLVVLRGDPVYPDEHAVIAAASSAVLTYLYPNQAAELAALARQEMDSRMWAGVSRRSDIAAGETLGRAVAQLAISRGETDGSDAAWTGTVPTGPGMWYSSDTPPASPYLPLFGHVRPWLMTSGDEFRPGPPPAYGSSEFLQALAVVRHISDTRTPEQVAIAKFWDDGAGTSTPSGHWNQIASDLITQANWNEIRAARALALLNMAEMDAGIACWDCKYTYWLLRPSQADPHITLVIALPNFPSYCSGHSAFSGAAGDVLGYLFPDQHDRLHALADEAGISRVYAGIHYPFDNDTGLSLGRTIAQLAITRGRADGAP